MCEGGSCSYLRDLSPSTLSSPEKHNYSKLFSGSETKDARDKCLSASLYFQDGSGKAS